MVTQERAIDTEIVHLSAGLFDTLACSAPVLPRIDPRDSLSAIEVEVEVEPAGKPPRVRTAWTMAAISIAAMAVTLAVQARKAPVTLEAPPSLRPGAEVTMVAAPPAPATEARPAQSETRVKAPASPASDAAAKAPRRAPRAPARKPLPTKAASLPAGPPGDFPPVPLAAQKTGSASSLL
jgi:hypothetical protein